MTTLEIIIAILASIAVLLGVWTVSIHMNNRLEAAWIKEQTESMKEQALKAYEELQDIRIDLELKRILEDCCVSTSYQAKS